MTAKAASPRALRQGDLDLLDHPVAQRLLVSAIPARVGYVSSDGSPRVTPMWFTWDGNLFILGAAGSSPKVAAIRANPRVAITIDSDEPPYELLTVRGTATVEFVDGAVAEYVRAATRYLGKDEGRKFRNHAEANFKGMARIAVEPDWVGVIDFQTRFPASH